MPSKEQKPAPSKKEKKPKAGNSLSSKLKKTEKKPRVVKPKVAKAGDNKKKIAAPTAKAGDKKKRPASKGGDNKLPTKKKKVEVDKLPKSTGGSRYTQLYQKRVRNVGIGNDVQPKRDLTRFVKWPRYIRVQRQKRILMTRLKVPPSIHQFTKKLDKNAAASLFKLLNDYRPETEKAKKDRLQKIGLLRLAKKTAEVPEDLRKPLSVTHGANNVVKAIENKKAKLVVIANDVDPIELVVALPTLCRKLEIPYVIVGDKSRLGLVTRRRNTTSVAITDIRNEDRQLFSNLIVIARETFNDNVDSRKQWGGGKLGNKSQQAIAKRQRIIAKEQAGRDKL